MEPSPEGNAQQQGRQRLVASNLTFDNSPVFNISSSIGSVFGELYGGGQFYVTGVERPGPGPVPEPGTLALLGIGLAGLGLSRRRTAA